MGVTPSPSKVLVTSPPKMFSQTTVGQIKGKHAYMSPEQAKGEPLDHRSDVFGLGTVFYELLTNTRLFKRETEIATLKAVVGHKVPPPSERARFASMQSAVQHLASALAAFVSARMLRELPDGRLDGMGGVAALAIACALVFCPLLLWIAIELSEGRDPIDGTPIDPVTVLWCDGEMGRDDLEELIRACGHEPLALANLHCTNERMRLDTEAGASRLLFSL